MEPLPEALILSIQAGAAIIQQGRHLSLIMFEIPEKRPDLSSDRPSNPGPDESSGKSTEMPSLNLIIIVSGEKSLRPASSIPPAAVTANIRLNNMINVFIVTSYDASKLPLLFLIIFRFGMI